MVFVMVPDGLFGSAVRHVRAFRTCSAVAPALFSGVSVTSLWGMGRCPAVFRNLFHEKRLSKYFTSAQCINMRFRRLFAGDRSCVSVAEEE